MTQAALIEHPGALPQGTRIDRYEVEQVLSATDAGVRYRCRTDDEAHETVAVVECFPPSLVRREGWTLVGHTARAATEFQTMLEQFRKDAANAMSFRHPGVVPLHRTFEANGTIYAVMDHVEGETLAALLEREGPLRSDRLATLTTGLLTSLGAMHGANLLHLGVEPGEIVLPGDDNPVVLASTLVRRSVGGARHAFAEAQQQQRRTAFVSSPYAAIELYAKGGRIGPWSDLYGLAATLYHCISGEAPAAALDRVLHDDLPTLESGDEDIDPGVLTAINAALEVQPDKRPRSVDGWRVVSQGSSSAVPARPGQMGARGGAREARAGGGRPRWALAAAALVAITVAVTYVDTGILRGGDDTAPATVAGAMNTPDDASGGDASATPTTDADGVPPVPDADGQSTDATPGEAPDATPATALADAEPPASGGDEARDPGPATAGAELADAADPADVADVADVVESPAVEASGDPAPAAPALPAFASLLVETVPAGVEVWMDDERLGETPLQLEDLTPGSRDISLRYPRYRTMNLTGQELVAGQQLYIERRLARATGNLLVTTEPPGAWVEWRDERMAEATPATLEGLPSGPVEITIGAAGYRPEIVSAEIPDDDTGAVTWTLTRAYGSLTLDLEPSDALATVLGDEGEEGDEGRAYAEGMELSEGPHRLAVERAGYVPQTVEVEVAGATRMSVALQPLGSCELRVRGVPPAARYPVARTFGGARRNLGFASIFVVFTVREDGTVASNDLAVDAERSELSDPTHLEAFSNAALDAVRRYEFDFAEGACLRRQRASLIIRFVAAPEG